VCHWCQLPTGECTCKAQTRDRCPLCGGRLLEFSDVAKGVCPGCGYDTNELASKARPTLFTADYLQGWRAWQVRRMEVSTGPTDYYAAEDPLAVPPMREALTLASFNGTIWLPGERFAATCAHGCKEVPGWGQCGEAGHGCGVYATKLHGGLHGFGIQADMVLGKVALWGSVWEHTDGYRAQYAYPLCFVQGTGSPGASPQLAEEWGVPLRNLMELLEEDLG
jgi:hypothetical protein